jgi:RNA polymerase sigma-70 factor (ECF subfamily)
MPASAELSLPDPTVAVASEEPRPAKELVVLAARRGDRASMQAIYEAEAPRLLRRLRHLTGSDERAQDLTHDAFVVAFSGRAAFAGEAALSTWLYGVALNLWRNDRRKSRRRKALLAARRPAEPAALESASAGVVVDELQRRLDDALARLSAPLREAFVLRAIEGLPLREAAQLAGVSQATMSKRARKAEARVRAAIDPQSEEQT